MELETAVERLYTDESLAADVDDKTAVPLLKWAESVLPVLVARGDEGFDEAFVTLKKLIKSVARLIDMRGEMDMAERAERAEKIQGFAQELGIPVNVDHLESLASFDGPELVAQMVGGATASMVPPPLPHEAAASAGEGATDKAQAQAVSDTGLPIEPRHGDTPLVTGTPEDVAEVRTGQRDAAVRPAGIPAEPTLQEQRARVEAPAEPTLQERRAGIEVPAEPTLQEQQAATEIRGEASLPEHPAAEIPAEASSAEQDPAEKPSLLDGMEAFFQRVAKRLDDDKHTDHPDDKE